MKNLLILVSFFTLAASAQIKPPYRLVEITREWIPVNMPLKDGFIHKYISPGIQAYYYQPGVDTFEITVTAKKINGPIITPPKDTIVDANVFNGLWKKDISGGFSFSNTTAQTLTLTFTGFHIVLVGLKHPSYGIVSITLDDRPAVEVDLYNAVQQKPFTMFDAGFAPGTHIVTLKVTGKKASLATNNYCVLDYSVISK